MNMFGVAHACSEVFPLHSLQDQGQAMWVPSGFVPAFCLVAFLYHIVCCTVLHYICKGNLTISTRESDTCKGTPK
jgi:hypothetical protein